jgi:preprotein translocase subunit YajC
MKLRSISHWLLLAALLLPAAGVWAQDDAPPAETPQVQPEQPADTRQPAPAETGGEEGTDPDVPTDETPEEPQTGPLGGQGIFLVLIGALVVMFLLSSRSRKKQEKKRREMLDSIKKGDKVTSIGGVVGTVMETRDDEIIVKVDEQNNVRMRFARWSIRGVGEQSKTDEPQQR